MRRNLVLDYASDLDERHDLQFFLEFEIGRADAVRLGIVTEIEAEVVLEV
jgi:hypothetical protein